VRVDFHVGPRHFLAAAESLLRSAPFSTNVMAVGAARIAAGDDADSEHHLWATIEDLEGHIVGAAMHTPPHHLFVSRMPAAGRVEGRRRTHRPLYGPRKSNVELHLPEDLLHAQPRC
jgi:hypothetical protein